MIKMVADLLFPTIGFAIGLAIIVKASDIAVDLSVEFSKITGMSRLSIGMLVLAAITSLPEFAIAMSSTFAGMSGIMTGNIFGSNITDLLLVMGAGALFFNFKISQEDSKKAKHIIIATSLLILYGLFYGYNIVFGFLCLLAFGFFFQGLLKQKAQRNNISRKNTKASIIIMSKLVATVAVVVLSACLVVICTEQISIATGMTNTIIGATIIAVATTLPELAVTISSGRKRQFEILIGNIFGSCFVNIALIMGISSVITPIRFAYSDAIVMISMFLSYAIAYFFIGKGSVSRIKGVILLFLYFSYLITMASIA